MVLLSSGEALALQTHGGAEGTVVHQLAHIQYLGALGYLIWDVRRSGFTGLGWGYLQWFCRLMILWNAVAFIGHLAQMALPEGAVTASAGYLSSELLAPITVGRWAYYLTALDHLLITPALFFLFLAMRFFYHSQNAASKGEN
ncbi:MAG: hypothetical protein IH612_12210 [Desulfofustis sp.]|nr:hypothetical protein [Desulfofustis sp.]